LSCLTQSWCVYWCIEYRCCQGASEATPRLFERGWRSVLEMHI